MWYLQSILSESIIGIFTDLILSEIDYLIFALEVSFYFVDTNALSDVEENEFIRDYTHFLESDRL